MEKNSTARRHHFLPQSYLALFTDKGTKKGQFHVLDVNSGHKFKTSPINVAVELDFNRVDINGHPPDVLENAFADMEGKAVNAISATVTSQEFPTDEHYNYILNLICLIAIRNPSHRNSFNKARERSIDIMGSMLVSDKKIFDYHVKKARADGIDLPEAVSYEEMQDFVENKKYKVEFYPEGNLRVELNMYDDILKLLSKRIWSLIIAPTEGPEFICSDHPVTIHYKSGRNGPIGLGSKNSEVFFPFSRHVGFYGTFEDPLKNVVHAKPKNVAIMNRRIALNAERHVFSPLESFVIWDEGKIKIINAGITN